MKITDVIIDPRTLGKKLLLVDVSPYYAYIDNKKTDTIEGYRYTVALPDRAFEKVAIKIKGEAQMDNPDTYIDVSFEGLELFIYWRNNEPTLGVRAQSIHANVKNA